MMEDDSTSGWDKPLPSPPAPNKLRRSESYWTPEPPKEKKKEIKKETKALKREEVLNIFRAMELGGHMLVDREMINGFVGILKESGVEEKVDLAKVKDLLHTFVKSVCETSSYGVMDMLTLTTHEEIYIVVPDVVQSKSK